MTPSRRSLLAAFLALPVAAKLAPFVRPSIPVMGPGQWTFHAWSIEGDVQRTWVNGRLTDESPAPRFYFSKEDLLSLDSWD